jgi:predicted Zn-dependent protease
MPRARIYTPQRLAKQVVQASKQSPDGFTLAEAKIPVTQREYALNEAKVIKPRMSKGQVVTRKTGKQGKPPVLYTKTITATTLAKAA